MANGHLPILGQEKTKASIQTIGALIHHLDENGQYEPQSILAGPNGMMVAIAGREHYVTAVDLVEMIRLVVREEIAALQNQS